MPDSVEITLRDEAATDRFGARLASFLSPGTVIALDGTLGAGKTRLVQAIGKAVGLDPTAITSPTFTLVHQYPFSVPDKNRTQFATPSGTIFHLDAYRVKSPEEFWELGVEEMFDSPNWTIIEWAERVKECLPKNYLQLTLEVVNANERKARISTSDKNYASLIGKISGD
jgi:tRNA threonylcarbamoyladenosine biosynthesis protein TsaE